jgi:hypothetical protein
LVCKIDGQSFTFGVGLSTLSVGPFGTWPEIKIDGNKYRFKISWSSDESTKGIKLEKLENKNFDEEIDEPSGKRKLHQLMNEIRNEFNDPKQSVKNQEELDDIEGYLHIHSLPPERRKQIIDQLKNKKG